MVFQDDGAFERRITAEEVIDTILKGKMLPDDYHYNPETQEIESEADMLGYWVCTYTNGEVKSIIVHTLDDTHSYVEIYLHGEDYLGMIYEALSEETSERLERIYIRNVERKMKK